MGDVIVARPEIPGLDSTGVESAYWELSEVIERLSGSGTDSELQELASINCRSLQTIACFHKSTYATMIQPEGYNALIRKMHEARELCKGSKWEGEIVKLVVEAIRRFPEQFNHALDSGIKRAYFPLVSAHV